MNSLETATATYWNAQSRFREGVAGPREFEDMVALTMSDDILPYRLWKHAFDLRMSMQCFRVDEITEIPGVRHG